MRIISLITAIAVVAILYVLVFERDVLQDFSKGKKIEEIAHFNNFSVVRDFCGHGVGLNFHENPSILHYYDKDYDNFKFVDGMIFTVEPMINAGKYHSKILNDGWTAVTKDKTLSAQYEHTVYINGDKIEILTESPNGIFYN